MTIVTMPTLSRGDRPAKRAREGYNHLAAGGISQILSCLTYRGVPYPPGLYLLRPEVSCSTGLFLRHHGAAYLLTS